MDVIALGEGNSAFNGLDAGHQDEVFFQTLVAPLPLEVFRNQYLHKQPLVLTGANKCYDEILRLGDLDRLFAASAANASDWFIFRAGSSEPRESFTSDAGNALLNRINELYNAGRTIHLRNTQKYLPEIERAWRQAEATLQERVKVNLWMTKCNEFTPFLHYDPHDLFILQINGSKHWKLYERNASRFTPRNPDVSVSRETVGPVMHDVMVQAGDLLYVPAGTPHEVTTCTSHSLHLAFVCFPVVWRDVVEEMLTGLDSRGNLLNDVVPQEIFANGATLQAALSTVVPALTTAVNFHAVAARIRAKFIQQTVPPRDLHFSSDILADVAINGQTRLQRRPGPCEVRRDATSNIAYILFADGGNMEGPLDIGDMLEMVATAQGVFTAEDLPSDWDIKSRTWVLGELLRRGLLERAT